MLSEGRFQMTFKSLKQITSQSINKTQFSKDENANYINKILTGCILLKTLQNIISISATYQDDIKSKADEYVNTYKNIAETLDGKFVSYKKIKETITKYNLSSFMEITEKQVNEIYKLYENKAEIKEFSVYYFSQYMYQRFGGNNAEVSRLSRVHFKIIVPIIKYYMTNFNIKPKDVSLEDVGKNFGVEIKLSISSIRNNQLYADIMRNLMNVKNYLYEVSLTHDGFVKLFIK